MLAIRGILDDVQGAAVDTGNFVCAPPPLRRATIHPDPFFGVFYQRTVTWLSERVQEREEDIVLIAKTLTRWPDAQLGVESSTAVGSSPVHGYKWTFQHRTEGWIYCVHTNQNPEAYRAELHHADRIRTYVDRAAEILQWASQSTRCHIQ